MSSTWLYFLLVLAASLKANVSYKLKKKILCSRRIQRCKANSTDIFWSLCKEMSKFGIQQANVKIPYKKLRNLPSINSPWPKH